MKFYVYRTSHHDNYTDGWIESFYSIEDLLSWVRATTREVIIKNNFLYKEDPDQFGVPAEWTTIKYALEIYDDYRE